MLTSHHIARGPSKQADGEHAEAAEHRAEPSHKIRNVVDQLPDEMKPSVRQAMRDAYAAS